MPNSPYVDTVFMLDILTRLDPASILDVGAGFGRWGCLCRCHLGDGLSLTAQSPQKLRIEAIEGWKTNVSPLYDEVYDKSHIGDACNVLPGLGKYDVIICSHMIEHLDKTKALAFIEEMKRHASRAVILAMPLGNSPQGVVLGNSLEEHKSSWLAHDFSGGNLLLRKFRFQGGSETAVVVLPMDDLARWNVKVLRSTLRLWLSNLRHAARELVLRRSPERGKPNL